MKVKLFQSYSNFDSYDNWESVLTAGLTDWEEVSEEDYTFIKNNLHLLRRKNGNQDNLVLVAQPDLTVLEIRQSLKKEIETLQKEEQKRKDEAARKRQEAADKKAAKAKEKELAQLKALQEKYGQLSSRNDQDYSIYDRKTDDGGY